MPDENQVHKTWWDIIKDIFGWSAPEPQTIKKVPKQDVEDVKND